MTDKKLRVQVWGTGGIGAIAIAAIRDRPDMELVGVWVHSEKNVGRDAGEFAGGPPLGVITTHDKDALIAMKPDCVFHATNAPEREASAVPDYERLLGAGINVVSTTSSKLIYPAAFEDKWRERIAAAAEAGQASIYASGIEPGFVCDYLALTLATQSRTIQSVHAYEMALYDDYPVASVMVDMLGFGKPLDYVPPVSTPGAIAHELGGIVQMVADALGATLDRIYDTYDRALTDRDLNVACGTLPAGTCGAIRLQCIGVVNGRDAIIIEHVSRMARDVGAEWPIGATDLAYRVAIKGEPTIVCDMDITLDEEGRQRSGTGEMKGGAGAMVSTAMRALNAIPYVVEGQPGLLSSLDLPLTLPRHAL